MNVENGLWYYKPHIYSLLQTYRLLESGQNIHVQSKSEREREVLKGSFLPYTQSIRLSAGF